MNGARVAQFHGHSIEVQYFREQPIQRPGDVSYSPYTIGTETESGTCRRKGLFLSGCL